MQERLVLWAEVLADMVNTDSAQTARTPMVQQLLHSQMINSRPQLTDAQKKEMDAKMKEDKANRDAYNKELKAILSSDQYSTYEKCMNNCNGGKHKGCKNCDKHK